MIVGLGCEACKPELLLPEGAWAAMAMTPDIMRMQEESLTGVGEIVASIDLAMADASALQVLDRRRARNPAPPPIIVVGMQCGGNVFSGVTANPALRSFAADLLVRAGAT